MKNVRTWTLKLTWSKSDVHLSVLVLDNRKDHMVVASKEEPGTLGVLLHDRLLGLDNLTNLSVTATFTSIGIPVDRLPCLKQLWSATAPMPNPAGCG